MLSQLIQVTKKAAKSRGIVLDRFRPHMDKFHVLGRLCRDHDCSLILDVGANDGGFARDMFTAGWERPIISVEPLEDPWRAIHAASMGRSNWTVTQRMCLGDRDGYTSFNVAANSVSSSVLDVLPKSIESNADTRYVEKVEVPIRKLDSLAGADEQLYAAKRFALKLDVQGFEGAVLDGAVATLPRIPVLIAEMSLSPLYAGAPSFEELYSRLIAAGYTCSGIYPGFTDPASMRMLQVDGIFERIK